eukprot:2860305-Amphidinium_carterae.1
MARLKSRTRPRVSRDEHEAAGSSTQALLRHVPVTDIVWLLNHVNPSVFTIGNFKALRVGGQRVPDRKVLCELIEFVTDWRLPNTSSFDTTTQGTLGQLSALLVKTTAEKGDRHQHLMMPPVWGKAGIFGLHYAEDTDTLTLSHRIHGWEP